MADPPPPIALPAVPFSPPTLHNALRNVSIQVVNEDSTITTEIAYLMQDSSNPSQCYQRWPKPSQPLNGKGEVLFCHVLLRDRREDDDRILFKRSDTTVAIKKLRRWIIDPKLQKQQAQGGDAVNENPYHEIRIMQDYGDYQHCMSCYEALWDKHYIYIVMLFVREGDLHSHVTSGLGGGYSPREDIVGVVKKLVENLQYLHQHNLIHRDLKPENVIHKTPWLPLIDFAMTLQVAVMEGVPQHLVKNRPAGSPAYISPEVFFGRPFSDKVDVWALGCIVWNLLTGLRLYDIPTDVCFRFFIQTGGIHDEALCDRRLEELLSQHATCDLTQRIMAVQVLTPVARDLLKGMLQENPDNRPSLEEILEHPFFQ